MSTNFMTSRLDQMKNTTRPCTENSMADEVGDQNQRFFVAVHVGAGYHAPSNEKALRSAMKRACLAAASVLRKVYSLSHTRTLLLLTRQNAI